jgi:hypothetical protein
VSIGLVGNFTDSGRARAAYAFPTNELETALDPEVPMAEVRPKRKIGRAALLGIAFAFALYATGSIAYNAFGCTTGILVGRDLETWAVLYLVVAPMLFPWQIALGIVLTCALFAAASANARAIRVRNWVACAALVAVVAGGAYFGHQSSLHCASAGGYL